MKKDKKKNRLVIDESKSFRLVLSKKVLVLVPMKLELVPTKIELVSSKEELTLVGTERSANKPKKSD